MAFDGFSSYQAVRRAEGWGAHSAAYYRNLPSVPSTDPHHSIWQVRTASFRALLRIIGASRCVLDLGAGNGWLAYQLTQHGHRVTAIDINDDALDGLGALQNYPVTIHAYRADFSALPFNTRFECIVFNASLHYARAVEPVIAEAQRVLADDGMIIVMDSPMYHDAASGRAMFSHKQQSLKKEFNLDISKDVSGFLTFADFEILSHAFSLDWEWVEPFVDWRWATRHLRARWRGQREPARFGLMIGRRKTKSQ